MLTNFYNLLAAIAGMFRLRGRHIGFSTYFRILLVALEIIPIQYFQRVGRKLDSKSYHVGFNAPGYDS